MSRTYRALWIVTILLITLACGLPSALSSAEDIPTSTPLSATSTQSQAKATQTASSTQTPSRSNTTPALTYYASVRVEVSPPIAPISITKTYAYFDSNAVAARAYMIVENNSNDPLDVITQYAGKVTWYDEKNQAVDSTSIDNYITNLFPQEKQLFEISLGKSKIADRKINLVKFEVTQVKTVKSFSDSAFKDKISKQKWSHPFATAKQVSFEVKPFMGGNTPIATSKVTVQNNMTAKFRTRVVGLYFNGKNELVGVGKLEAIELPALGSINVEFTSVNLSGEPVKMEYFVESPNIGIIDFMALFFP